MPDTITRREFLRYVALAGGAEAGRQLAIRIVGSGLMGLVSWLLGGCGPASGPAIIQTPEPVVNPTQIPGVLFENLNPDEPQALNDKIRHYIEQHVSTDLGEMALPAFYRLASIALMSLDATGQRVTQLGFGGLVTVNNELYIATERHVTAGALVGSCGLHIAGIGAF